MWKELGLRSEVVEALKKCGFEKPTEIQQKSIKSILQGKDLVGGSATGSGKTLAFGLPAIEKLQIDEKGIETLIVCPTRELAIQVCDEIKKVAEGCGKNKKDLSSCKESIREIQKSTEELKGTSKNCKSCGEACSAKSICLFIDL